jgi:pyruvate dehydrogenase (quinone)
MAGDPKFETSQNLPDFPYAEYGRMLGLGGIRVDRPEALGAAWEEALSSNRPTVLEVVTDPDVPPLPPHVTFKQGKAFASALYHRDPDSIDIIIASAKQWWASVAPGKH